MRKNSAIYSVAIVLMALSFLYFNRAYTEKEEYSALTTRSVNVNSDFQSLSRQITDAAVINPDLVREVRKGNASLFYANSISILKQLEQLKSDVRDSINIRIASQLDSLIKAELPWLLKSGVPDSILHHKSQEHVAALLQIHFLTQEGISRTAFLFEHRKRVFTRIMG